MDLSVLVTLLGEKQSGFPGILVAVEDRKICVRTGFVPQLRSAVKVETEDRLWMGEVIGVLPQDSACSVDIWVLHELRGTEDLKRLAEQFIGKIASTEKLPVAK